MAVFVETIDLKDGVSAPAKAASAAVASLGSSVVSTQGSLAKVSASTSKLGASASSTSKVFPNLTDKLMNTQGTITGYADAADKASSSSAGFQAELAEMTGGLSIAIEILGAVALGLGAIVFAGAKLAISANEAKAKMTSLFDALGEGKITGQQTIAMLDDLGGQLGLTRDQLAPFTKGFLTLGITGVAQLRELTIAAAGLDQITTGAGDAFTKLFGKVNAAAEAGQKLTLPFPKLVTSLKAAGLNIGDLATEMGITQQALTSGLKAGTIDAKKFGDALTSAATSKGAGPLANAGRNLANIWGKFQENITKMFEDIDVGPFLKEVKDLFAIFDSKVKPSGDALKSGIGGFFKQVFAQLTKVVPLAKHFLLDMVIYGLKAYIALKPIFTSIKEFATSPAGVFAINGLVVALKAIGVVVLVVVGIVVGLVAVMVVMSAAVGAVLGSIISLGTGIGDFIAGAASALGGWIASAATAAYDFVAGLVSGISGGVSSVVNAVKGLGSAALGAITGVFDSHSPSKVMVGIGGDVTDGLAQGMDAGAGDVHGAASGAAQAGVKGASSGGDAPATGGGGSKSTTINVHVSIEGAGKSALEITQEMVAQVLERSALAAGV